MLICFILFRTQLPVTERFHITEIRLKIRFHNNKCILICNCAVFQIFQHLSFQFIIIWGIHKNNVKNKQYTSISGGMPGISICLYVLGFIMILAGIFVGAQLGDAGMREFNWAFAIICWGAFLTGSLFLFGFGKIIALLNDIKNK